MRRLMVLVLALISLPTLAQTVSLTVTKSGADVVLTWTGGTGPYQVLRSSSPSMSIRTAVVADAATSPTTDAGGATRGASVEYYQVSEAARPTVAIATPAPGFTATGPCLCATGTSTSATAIYVNSTTATGTTTWAACPNTTGVPLAVQGDPRQSAAVVITASASDTNGNWASTAISGTYTGTITAQVPCAPRSQGM